MNSQMPAGYISEQSENINREPGLKEEPIFERHSVNCPNENVAFASLRMFYPYNEIWGLWDMFVKCNGDINWAMELLQIEDEIRSNRCSPAQDIYTDCFECQCRAANNSDTNSSDRILDVKIDVAASGKPQDRRLFRFNFNHVQLSEENYSSLREKEDAPKTAHVKTVRLFEDTEDEQNESNELVELKFESGLLKQLKTLFEEETKPLMNYLPENGIVKTIMPRSLAKELYLLSLESIENQKEEERYQTFCDEKQIELFLEMSDSDRNIHEEVDLEHIHQVQLSVDTMVGLPEIKFGQTAEMPREKLAEVLADHSNNHQEAVEDSADLPEEFRNINSDAVNIEKDQEEFENVVGKPSPPQKKSKFFVLEEFEELRNLGGYYRQLMLECHQKAQAAAEKGNSRIAAYFSEMADLHKMKLEFHNQQAVTCLTIARMYTQNNDELLDLHNLYVSEAVTCLDIFLDRHITALRAAPQWTKHVFIITGRGRHSARGFSTVKTRVKRRLKKRCLTWIEANPGQLKVNVQWTSPYSTSI